MSGQDEGARPPLRGDEAELFRDFNRQFVRTVQWRTNAPREIVDDACAFAWQQVMRHQPDRDRNWRAWMLTTAEREAWRLREIEASHLSLSVDDDETPVAWDVPDRRDQLAIRMRLREALGALADVPEGRRDIKALQITGFQLPRDQRDARAYVHPRQSHARRGQRGAARGAGSRGGRPGPCLPARREAA
jgi:hypothetical protein